MISFVHLYVSSTSIVIFLHIRDVKASYIVQSWLNVSSRSFRAATEFPGIDFRNYRLPELFPRLNIQISCCVQTTGNISLFRLISSVMLRERERKRDRERDEKSRKSGYRSEKTSCFIFRSRNAFIYFTSVRHIRLHPLDSQAHLVDKFCSKMLRWIKERFASYPNG